VTPVFTGRVLPGGLLVIDRRADYARHVRSLHGRFVEVIVRKQRTKRSLAQNAWHWAIAVPLIAEALGYDKHEHDQVHYALVAKCFGTTANAKTGLDVPKARSSHLTTEQFSELMEWEVRFAAEFLDVLVPLPNEVAA
jgi:hypothetical protein